MNSSSENTTDIPVILRTSAPSYIQNITGYNEDVVLIYKTVEEKYEKCSPIIVDDTNCSLDLTGNPLKVDLDAGDCTLNVSVGQAVNPWHAEENGCGGLDVKTVRKTINSELTKCHPEDNIYIYGLCDGKSKDKLLVLGAQGTNKFLSRTQIFANDMFMVNDEVSQSMEKMKMEHHKNAQSLNEIRITHVIRGMYLLYGEKILLSPSLLNLQFSGSISCDISWSTFRYTIPQYVDTVEMTLQVIIGHKVSQLHSYWNHLMLLKNYTNILMKRQHNLGLVSLNKSCKDYMDIVASCNTLISDVMTAWRPPPSKGKKDLNFENLRRETFTDKLWEMLIYCRTVNDLRFCLHCLFEELVASGFSLNPKEFPSYDRSFILKILIEISNGRITVPTLSPSQALTCLIELGIEKLKRDYFYILDYCNCLNQEDAAECSESIIQLDSKSSTSTTIAGTSAARVTAVRLRLTVDPAMIILNSQEILKKYNCLLSMHVASDTLVLALKSSNLHQCLRDIRNCLLNKQTKIDVSNPLFEVKVKLDSEKIKSMKLQHPISWNIKFSSTHKRDTVETIFHHTVKKLFPPTLYDYNNVSNDSNDSGISYFVAKLARYIKRFS